MSHDRDRVVAGLISEGDLHHIREAVCIHTEKIYDSCKDKDCIEDAQVVFKNPRWVQMIVNRAISVKIIDAEIKFVYTDVEPVPFKRGFYTVDIKYFIKVTLNFLVPGNPKGHSTIQVEGLVIFDKKVILFGSEGGVKIFKSQFHENNSRHEVGNSLQQDNSPIVKVEVAEPIALNARIVEVCERHDCCLEEIPQCILDCLCDNETDVAGVEDNRGHHTTKEVVVSIGLFSITKLLRVVQLLIPAFDFCVPEKECVSSTDENPCDIFDTIDFPVDEFFPPQIYDFPGALPDTDEDCKFDRR
ncbi:MAG TPA: hypothetical protein DDZ89_04200 [Clostridiales bacterium]|nr:hypothetical protein [Clostridiales bacterium]